MLVNFSSISDDLLGYNSSDCRFISFLGFSAVKFLFVFPLCIFVLYLGFQRWRQQRSSNPVSHSDIITYQLAVLELLWGPGFVLYLCGRYLNNPAARQTGACAFSLVFYGEMFFHMLTCVDWYLAVVHPITYMGLRSARGLKIRSVCMASGWLLCLGLVWYDALLMKHQSIVSLVCFLAASIVVITFCSFSVLCVLVHPRPGGGGGDKERVHQLKRRAFHTITAIWGVLTLWFLAFLVSNALSGSPFLTEEGKIFVFAVLNWFDLPVVLVSPLLFLQRAGKLSCGRFNRQNVFMFRFFHVCVEKTCNGDQEFGNSR